VSYQGICSNAPIRAGYVDAADSTSLEPTCSPQPRPAARERALRIRCSFLPGDDTVERKLKDYILDEIDLRAMVPCSRPLSLSDRAQRTARPPGRTARKGQSEKLDRRIDVFTTGHHQP